MDQFEIATRRNGPVEVLSLRGPLVLGPPVDTLDRTLENLLAHGVTRIVMDITEVKRIDSSGIGALARTLQHIRERGGLLKLVNPSKQVTQALTMCRLLPLFQIHATEEEALASPECQAC